MTEFSGPFDVDPPDTEGGYEGMYQDEWSRMARVWAEDAVVGDQGGPALQVYIAGAQVGVRLGEAEIRGYWYRNTAPILWTPAPNAAGQPRTDLVVLRLDRAAKEVKVKVVAGTAGSGEPALTQSDADDGVWEIPLGGYVIPAGDTLPSGQFDKRTFQGLRIWRPSSQDVLPQSGAPLWQPAVLPDGRRARWSGTAWVIDVPLTPWVMQVSTAYIWPGAAERGTWWRRDGIVEAFAATSLSVSPPYPNVLSVTFPGPSLPPGTYVGHATLTDSAGHVRNHGYLLVQPNGVEAMLHANTGPPSVSPAAGDTVTAEFRYPQQ